MTEPERDLLREMRPVIRSWLEQNVDGLPQGDQLPDRVRDRVLEEVRRDASRPSASRPFRGRAFRAALSAPSSHGSSPQTRLVDSFGAAKLAAAVVVMVVAGVLLAGVLGRPDDSHRAGVAPTQSPVVTELPSSPRVIIVDPEGRGDHTTIGEALDAAVDGDEIVIRPGYYPESLVITKDVTVRGEGAPGGVVIEYGDWSPTFEDRAAYERTQHFGVHLRDSDASVSNLVVSGPRVGLSVVITGGSPTLDGLILDQGPKSVSVSDDGRESIRVYGAGHPTIRNSTWDGFYWEAPGAAATVEGNIVTDACLYLEGGRESHVLDNHVGECIRFMNGTSGRIEGNVLENGWIGLDGAGDVAVRGNTLRGRSVDDDCGVICIDDIGTGSEVSGNSVSEADVAISIASVTEVPLTGNVLRSNEVGVLSLVQTWPALEGNVFCGNGADLAFGPGVAPGAQLPSLDGNEVCAASTS